MERGLRDLMTRDLTDGTPFLRVLSKYTSYAFLSLFNMLFENPVQKGSERGWKLLGLDGIKLINSRGPESYARRLSLTIMRQA